MFRNLLHTIRRFKAAFILNVLGLSIAFAASLLIMMQVRFDLTFDTCYEDAEDIYRLDMRARPDTEEQCTITRPLARNFIASSPDILHGCITETVSRGGMYASEDGRSNEWLNFTCVSPEFPDVFGFVMLEGDRNALSAPDAAIIPESLALNMFGSTDIIGTVLRAKDNNSDMRITGVYRDLPSNASIRNSIYMAIDRQQNYDNRQNFNYHAFVKLAAGADPGRITENFIKDNPELSMDGNSDVEFSLKSLNRLHFIQGVSFDSFPKSSWAMIYSLISIIVVLIVIAGINFNNFSISIAPMRFRSIATKRILGSSLLSIRTGIIGETMVITAAAYMVSLLILCLCRMTPVAGLIEADISLASNTGLVVIGAAVAVVTGILIGIYPAYCLTAFSPAEAVKGNPGLTPSGRKSRTVLLGVQFTAALVLMAVTSYIFLQNRYLLNAPLGFDKDEIIVCQTGGIRQNGEAVIEELKKIPGVANAGYAQAVPGSADYYQYWSMSVKEQHIGFTALYVDASFLDVMGIDIIDGRGFKEGDINSEYACAVFSRTAQAQYGLTTEEILHDWIHIIGICDDIKFATLRKEITPVAFVLSPYVSQFGQILVRMTAGADLKATRQAIEECVKGFSSDYPVYARFYNTILEDTYRKEQKTGSLVSLFSMIAIIISIVGVFSLVTFECGYRRKESAIRKVVGATSAGLVWMFCRKYLAILGICFIISIPVSIIVAQRWLEGFAYHIPLYWWVFPAVFTAIAAITLATVIWQSRKAADENPVNNLRTD